MVVVNPAPIFLKKMLEEALNFGHKKNWLILYYTGHGKKSGDWILKKGKRFSFADFASIAIPLETVQIRVWIDSCYSGMCC